MPNFTRIVARKHTRDVWRPYVKDEQQRQVESEVNRTVEDACFFGRYYAASSKTFSTSGRCFLGLLENGVRPLGDRRNADLVVALNPTHIRRKLWPEACSAPVTPRAFQFAARFEF